MFIIKYFLKLYWRIKAVLATNKDLHATIKGLLSKNTALEKQNTILLKDIAALKWEIENYPASRIVERVLKRGIKWVDIDKMEKDDLANYLIHARDLLTDPVFKNESFAFMDDLKTFCATKAEDFKHVRDFRSKIVSQEVLRERIVDLANKVDEVEGVKKYDKSFENNSPHV